MRQEVEYMGIKSLIWLIKRVPESFIYKVSEKIVKKSYGRGSKREKRIKKHLGFVFKDKNKIDEVYNEYLQHKASFFAEIALMIGGKFNYEDAVINLKEAQNKIGELKSINKSGMIFLVSHYGNWEFLAQFFAINGLPGTLVAKEYRKNVYIEKKIIQPYRKMFGHKVIKREGAIREIVKILKNRGGIGIHIDQMIPPPNGVEIDFFGEKVYSSKSMAQLKLKLNPLVIPIFAKRVGFGKFEILIGEIQNYTAQEVDNRDEKIKKITQKYNDILAKQITSSPAQWAWEYKRWRKPK